MPESNDQTAESKAKWPWWLGGMALLAVAGVLARFVARACRGKCGEAKGAAPG